MNEKNVIDLGSYIGPKAKMAPNELCWCRSGKKWKKCHKDREHRPPANPFEMMMRQDEIFRAGFCSHPEAPDGCSGKTIRSHTIQKSGGLSAIAEEGHVLSGRGNKNSLHKTGGRLTPQRTGINSASTYNGFCGPHDASLFLPIEKGAVSLTSESAFLSVFRGVAFENFNKRAELVCAHAMRDTVDAGKPLHEQVRLQNFVAGWVTGIEIALEEIGGFKSDLDRRFYATDFSGISAYEATFEGVLPIAVLCAFHPEFDLQGARLQSLAHLDLEYVTLGTSVRNGKTVVTFGWIGGPRTPGAKLAASYQALAPEDKATALALLCFIHSENWHARPSWWEGLTTEQQRGVERLMRRGMPSDDGERIGDEYLVLSAPVRIDVMATSGRMLPLNSPDASV